MHEFAVLGSTNDKAVELPAWHAVRADSQTAGRGRWNRAWVSDLGGLWISAVLPMPGDPAQWQALPIAVGLAVSNVLRDLGIRTRLRWPNDVLVGRRKLAGLLVDCCRPGLAVAGIGINVTNRPDNQDPTLSGQAVCISELVSSPPDLDRLSQMLLFQLKSAHRRMEEAGFGAIAGDVNELWALPREVELDLGHHWIRGWFQGVDESGRLGLATSDEARRFAPNEVIQLREVEPNPA